MSPSPGKPKRAVKATGSNSLYNLMNTGILIFPISIF